MTPAAGQWIALGPDPYGFELFDDGSQLSGQGCLGALPSQGDPLVCTPLTIEADRGRRLAFVWDMNHAVDATGIVYVVKMELTLAPERTAMAGTVWTSLGPANNEGQDIVLVRYPDQPVPPATVCSEGEPSGACFLAPLRSDWVEELRVVELGGGNLLLLWKNRRGIGHRIASARFDATAGAWQDAEFLDDGIAPVGSPLLAASPEGWAMVAYDQGNVLVTRAYDPERNTWSEQQQLVLSDDSSASPSPEALLVYDGGDATLIASSLAEDGSTALSAHDYAAKAGRWESPHLLAASPGVVAYQWAAASDAARNQLVIWADEEFSGEPNHLWFSRRSDAATWTAPAVFHTSDKQLLRPAAAVASDGTAYVTWQEFLGSIGSAAYSFETGAWSEALTVTAEQQIAEATGARYSVMGGTDLQVTPLYPRAGETTPPPFSRALCEGYPATANLSTNDSGGDFTLRLNQQLELTLLTIGGGDYGAPVISSPAVTFEGMRQPKTLNPGGPTQKYLFRTVADGAALITIPHDGGRDPFTVTLRCCAQ